MQQPLLVGVCGGTGSGKTTVAQAISAALGHKCVILPQDAGAPREDAGVQF